MAYSLHGRIRDENMNEELENLAYDIADSIEARLRRFGLPALFCIAVGMLHGETIAKASGVWLEQSRSSCEPQDFRSFAMGSLPEVAPFDMRVCDETQPCESEEWSDFFSA